MDEHRAGWLASGRPRRAGRTGSVTFHKITVLSPLPVARVRPSGENATESTTEPGPYSGSPRGAGRARSVTSQMSLPVVRMCPSGENASDLTGPPLVVSG